MQLYGERVGSLQIVCANQQERDVLQTRFTEFVIPEYLNPPINGARIVVEILSDEELKREWKLELQSINLRIRNIRSEIVDKLKAIGSKHDWSHI